MIDDCGGEPVPFAGWVQYSDDTVGYTIAGGTADFVYTPPNDPVNHPKHYTSHPSGVECIQITRHMGYNLGNAVKYIWRCDLKRDAIEDLKKAVFYLNDEIAMRERQRQEELEERTGF